MGKCVLFEVVEVDWEDEVVQHKDYNTAQITRSSPAQNQIHHHHRPHPLHDRRSTRQHTRIVSALPLEGNWVAFKIAGQLRFGDGGNWLERHFKLERFSCGNTAQTASRVVSLESQLGIKGVVVLRPHHFGSFEARAELEALGGWYGKHGMGHECLDFVKDRLSQSDGQAIYAALDSSAQ